MSAAKSAFGVLQKIGKALMLPVAVLPAAGILLGVGSAQFMKDLSPAVANVMAQAGGAVFGNLALIFAIGVVLGLTANDGVAALAAVVGYAVMTNTLAVMASSPARVVPPGEAMRAIRVSSASPVSTPAPAERKAPRASRIAASAVRPSASPARASAWMKAWMKAGADPAVAVATSMWASRSRSTISAMAANSPRAVSRAAG